MADDLVLATLAALKQSVDDFHNRIFPLFCGSIETRVVRIEGKIDDQNHGLAKAVDDISALKIWRAEVRGAVIFAKSQWQIFLGLVGGGGVAGGIFWVLGRISGHI